MKSGAAWVYAWGMSWRLLPVPAAAILALCLGCATSGGSLYRDTAAAERQQTESRRESAAKPEPAQPAAEGLAIESDPDGASVYLNNRYVGETPLLLEDLGAGRYQLRLERDGYYPHDAWIDYAGGHMVFRTDLRQITGFLQVEVQPPQAAVVVGERSFPAGSVQELAVGLYTARVRLFGFEDYAAQVRVEEKSLTRLAVALVPAALRLEDLRSGRRQFNPRNPGLLGRARIRFRVSSYGSGRAAVLDAEDHEVWQKPLPRFTSWEQALDWDGRASSGSPLADGDYTLMVEASPEEGGEALQARIPLRIDSSLKLSYRLLWNGASGLLYVPSPEVLPRGGVQTSTLLASHAQAAADGYSFRTPWDLGVRLGLGTPRGLELDLHTGVILGYGEVVPWFASAAAKFPLSRGAVQTAALAKLGYQSVRTDSFANFTGLTLGLPASASLGVVSFFIAPELTVSLWEVSYAEPEDWPSASLTAWAYAKGGIALDLDPWTLGFSVAARTLPFGRGFGFDLPVQGGVEVHWMIPGTQLFLTAAVTGEARGVGSYYFSGGAGLGLLD